ncbi:MAG TPA: hypothetical protein ENH62_10160 [Marinobacter sp.]|uniref:Methyltransferase type 11 domain-containing protein n=1 Tax=marine sediment metagenome TaxID=412755 RepID=A0A0F9NIY0_9ZZZZ|nr:hypothetical protein [Marinobacter sp.]
MNRIANFEHINGELLSCIPEDQFERVMSSNLCDIDPEFLGFVDIYKHLSEIIPLDFTVVDLGCAYAPQAFLFEHHRAYIGVDISDCQRFKAKNSTHHQMPIIEFLGKHGSCLRKETTFAICSYVPPWHDDNMKLVREFFINVFTFYPCGSGVPSGRSPTARWLNVVSSPEMYGIEQGIGYEK